MESINQNESEARVISVNEIWQAVNKGIIAFAIIHLIFEYAIDNTKTAGSVVAINYLISRWYAKRQIKRGLIPTILSGEACLYRLWCFFSRWCWG